MYQKLILVFKNLQVIKFIYINIVYIIINILHFYKKKSLYMRM